MVRQKRICPNLCSTCYILGPRKKQDKPRRKHSYGRENDLQNYTKKKSQISNTMMDCGDGTHLSHEDYYLSKVLNEDESKSLKWRQRALAIDRLSLQFFPFLFAVIIAMYGYVYLSG